jgi:hypothetical protein
MSTRLMTLCKWHIGSHRARAWQKVVDACQGDEVDSDGTLWRYCDLRDVESVLTLDELRRYIGSEFPHHWEHHDEYSGFARVDEPPARSDAEENTENAASLEGTDSPALPCAGGKCPCCVQPRRSRGCWCSWHR